MGPQDKLGILLRRFGFGASAREMAKYEGLEIDKAVDRLLSFPAVPNEEPPLLRASYKEGSEDSEPGWYRFRPVWIHHLLTSEHPLRERLALFYHDHFAVTVNDVEHGLAWLDYFANMRRLPSMKFAEVMHTMLLDPALMLQLNANTNRKGNPNENLAREILELYTVGLDNYTERDIKDAARALTGLTFFDEYWISGDTNNDRLEVMRREERNLVGGGFVPSFHDEGEKEVLGLKGKFGPFELSDYLAKHDLTARHLCGKLWRHFVGKPATEGTVNILVDAWRKSDGDVREVLRTMTRIDLFWDDSITQVCPPTEYMFRAFHAFGLAPRLVEMNEPNAAPTKPIPEEHWSEWNYYLYSGLQMGQEICRPPSVAGWELDKGWISTNTLMRRKAFSPAGLYAQNPANENRWEPTEFGHRLGDFVDARAPKSNEEIVDGVALFFGTVLRPETRAKLAEVTAGVNGKQAFAMDNRDWKTGVCYRVYEFLRATPEFNLA